MQCAGFDNNPVNRSFYTSFFGHICCDGEDLAGEAGRDFCEFGAGFADVDGVDFGSAIA
jgi:hypothetical protein